jgi:peroxiredoxin
MFDPHKMAESLAIVKRFCKYLFMKSLLKTLLSLCVCFTTALSAAVLQTGNQAPLFSLSDIKGHEITLESFNGKWVVLEWTNPNCPFVKKFYAPNKMQELQRDYMAKGVIWLTINSTHKEHPDYLTPKQTLSLNQSSGIQATTQLLDSDGTVGKAYGAVTTPHLFIINPSGILIYQGAIDSIRSTKAEDISNAENYVKAVLDAVLENNGTPISETKPYGCSVKYTH